MKFRIVDRKRSLLPVRRRRAVCRGRNMPRTMHTEQIRLGDLFSRGALAKEKRRALWRAWKVRMVSGFGSIWKKMRAMMRRMGKAFSALRRRRGQKEPKPSMLAPLLGALCGSLCIMILSAALVLYTLLFADHHRAHVTVTVPALTGVEYTEKSVDTKLFAVSLSYEYHESAPKNTVLSQTPTSGVQRRVYKNGERCTLSLVLSLGRHSVIMGDLTGKSLRDASLSLKNQGVRIRVTEAYSENVPVGCVITTEPAVGQAIFDSEYAVLQVSRGPKEYPATVPSLVGLTESHAVEMLIASGLKVGEIRYERSDASAGTVLWQSMPENSTVPKGSAISLKISAGGIYQVMEVPDLYGLTLSDAKRRLEEAGLVCGRVYTVSDGTKNGTVVAQSILPGTPITSALTAVDLYISS